MNKIIKNINYVFQNVLIGVFVVSIIISFLIGITIANVFDINTYSIFSKTDISLFTDIFIYVFYVSIFTYIYFFIKKIKTHLLYSKLHTISICVLCLFVFIQPFYFRIILTLQVITSAIFLLNVYYTFLAERKDNM